VVGSLALGAWRADRSDLDVVIFTSRAPTADDTAVLRDLHEALRRRPYLDGVYLSPGDGFPADRRVMPFVMDGVLHTGRPCDALTPVLWLTLLRYGIAVRGPEVRELGVSVDSEALRAYNLENLRTYWQGQAAGIRRYAAGVDPSAPVDSEYAAWVVLGPPRLHYTLAHEDIVSKSAAGEYLKERFPEHASLAERAIRWRDGEAVAFTAEDLLAAASLVDLVADDAWRRFGL
jgi:hypothetical protein